jgi:hypothetical protein
MYQLIKEICKHPEDETKLQLIFANQVRLNKNIKQFFPGNQTKII